MKKGITYLLTFLGIIIVLPGIIWIWGMLLPENHSVSVSQTFKATPEEVYQLLTGVKDYPSWRSDVTRVEILETDNQPREWKEFYTDNDPLAFRINIPDSSLISTEIISENLPFGGGWFFYIESQETGTELTITEEGKVYNPLFRVISKYFIGHDTTIRRYLEDLGKELQNNES